MNHFRQRIPGGCDPSMDAEEFDFDNTKELIQSDIVQRFLAIEDNTYLAMSDELLMIVSSVRKFWWAIGYVTNPDDVDLPKWQPND